MKLDCDVIRDLLPLYHDRVCSEKTAELVQEHLSGCEDCRDYLEALDEDLNLGDPVEKVRPLRDVGKRIQKMKWLAFSLGLLAAAAVGFLGWAAAAKYSIFVGYLLDLMKQGLTLMVPMLAILIPAVLLIRKWYQKKKKVFPWGKAVSWILFLGWMGIYVYASLLHGSYWARHLNLQPFLMLREALNRFTPQLILNLFINIAVFVPFGILLPLLSNREKKWYWVLLTAMAMAVGFEGLQFATAHGICDIDDVLMDTLGAMLGWSGTMLVLSLHNGEKAKSLRYLTVPGLALLAAGLIFGGYWLKPYGNFPDGPAKWVDCSQVCWEKTEDMDGSTGMSAPVYKVGRITREQSEQFAMEFAARLGIRFDDVMYYDTEIIYANRRGEGGFLSVYYQDGSWDYSMGPRDGEFFENPLEEQDHLKEYLEKLGVKVPESAEFVGENMDSKVPVVRIRIQMDHDGENLRHGELACQFFEMEGKYRLMEVDNRVFSLETVGHEKILGEEEAWELLRKGKSFRGRNYDGRALRLSVSRPSLDWQTDTKGFFQPVYRFTVTDQDSGRQWDDFVAALP